MSIKAVKRFLLLLSIVTVVVFHVDQFFPVDHLSGLVAAGLVTHQLLSICCTLCII